MHRKIIKFVNNFLHFLKFIHIVRTKAHKMCYNTNMENKYLIKKVGKYTFKFKLDLNPITNEYEPHIYHRHLITPNEAIKAFFTSEYEEYNNQYKRYEAYSEKYNITLYYMKLKEKNTYLFIITAFNDWR